MSTKRSINILIETKLFSAINLIILLVDSRIPKPIVFCINYKHFLQAMMLITSYCKTLIQERHVSKMVNHSGERF